MTMSDAVLAVVYSYGQAHATWSKSRGNELKRPNQPEVQLPHRREQGIRQDLNGERFLIGLSNPPRLTTQTDPRI
jgi:hypothetical protein